MKTLILFILLLSNLNLFSQYEISPRIGNEIDKYERNYFGLFPSIKNFVSVKFSIPSDQKVTITITKSENSGLIDTSFSIGIKSIDNLVIYIEGFELCRKKEREVNWNVFNGLASPNYALISEINFGTNVKIITKNNQSYFGRLLFVSDSSIVVFQGNTNYEWKKFKENSKVIKVIDLESITIERDGNFANGVGYGALIGGAPVLILGVSEGGYSDGLSTFVTLLVATSTAIFGGSIGGTIGAILDIDTEWEIGGSYNQYQNNLESLRNKSIFSSFAPPELVKFAKD